MQPPSPTLEIVTELPALPPRPAASNKGDFGRVLVAAGSRGMAGAAVLCATAALRGGAGLVRLAVPAEVLPQVAIANPCYLTAALPQDLDGRFALQAEEPLLALAQASTVLAVGPGLGRSPDLSALVASLLARVTAPLVLDADGLNAVLKQTDRLQQHRGPLVLTPHPGEFARLVGGDVPTVQAFRQELAVCFALEYDVVLVLKGHRTVVTNGRRVYLNTTGNPGMATGGTGDVLTGLIAALLGQGLEPFAAAQLGVYLHGLAGDLARDDLGEVSLIATDLIDYLPRAFLQGQRKGRKKKGTEC
jgi:NAD(P)H-hydrate epimerase